MKLGMGQRASWPLNWNHSQLRLVAGVVKFGTLFPINIRLDSSSKSAQVYLDHNRVDGGSHSGPDQGRQRQKRELHGVYYTDLHRKLDIANGSEGKPPGNKKRKERQLEKEQTRIGTSDIQVKRKEKATEDPEWLCPPSALNTLMDSINMIRP
jgi:hypothetical protein